MDFSVGTGIRITGRTRFYSSIFGNRYQSHQIGFNHARYVNQHEKTKLNASQGNKRKVA